VDLGLKGRTALICGASSGLGLASAEALSAEGANVTMFARRRDVLQREADRIGALDILVWNSGGPPAGRGTEMTADSVEQALELMLAPAVRLVNLALPHLEQSPGARIIAITSLAAKEPTRHLALSNTFRPAVHGYLKTLADELGPRGITVNCVAPGRIKTPRLEYLYPEGPTEQALSEIPLRRWGDPREFGDVVCFVASERARYVTGQTFVVDGGLQRALF